MLLTERFNCVIFDFNAKLVVRQFYASTPSTELFPTLLQVLADAGLSTFVAKPNATRLSSEQKLSKRIVSLVQ